jgi:hypothetical protein
MRRFSESFKGGVESRGITENRCKADATLYAYLVYYCPLAHHRYGASYRCGRKSIKSPCGMVGDAEFGK